VYAQFHIPEDIEYLLRNLGNNGKISPLCDVSKKPVSGRGEETSTVVGYPCRPAVKLLTHFGDSMTTSYLPLKDYLIF
jgi:hypothetical protein